MARRTHARLPSAFIALTAGGLCAAQLAARVAHGNAVVSILGLAMAGALAMTACFALAEMRSTAPLRGGTWHFARMLYGVQGGFLLAWLEVLAMIATAGMFLLAARDLGLEAFAALAGVEQSVTSAIKSLASLLGLGSPVTGFLLAWILRGPATPRRRSWFWRRALKWVSVFALMIGWGVALRVGWEFMNARAIIFQTQLTESLPTGFLRGMLAAFACFFYVVHSVPGDVPDFSLEIASGTLGEHRRYRLPRGMILGLLTALLTAVATGLAAASVNMGKVGGEGVHASSLAWLMLAAALAALGGCAFGMARSVRTMSALAREGMLPPWLGRPDSQRPKLGRTRQVIAGCTASGMLLLMMAVARDWWSVSVFAAFLHAVLGAATCFCQVHLRREAGDEVDYGFVLPGFPWLPVAGGLGALLVAGLCIWVVPASALIGAAVLASGLVLHEAYARSHSLKRSDDDMQELLDFGDSSEDHAGSPRGTIRVLVAANQEPTAVALLETARRLCGRLPTQLNVLNILTVPENACLSDAARNVSEAVSFAKSIHAKFAASGVPIRVMTRCAHSAARGILTTLRESGIDLLLLGWHGRMHRGMPTSWGRTLDPVLRRTPCNVIVAKGLQEAQRFRHILVPVTDTEHSAFALNVASRLAEDSEDSEIEIFSVLSHGVSGTDAHGFLRKHVRRIARSSMRVMCRTETYSSIADGILEEVIRGRHDLIVMGTTPPEQAQSDEETVTTQVASRTSVPCVVVSVTSAWKLWRNRWLRAE